MPWKLPGPLLGTWAHAAPNCPAADPEPDVAGIALLVVEFDPEPDDEEVLPPLLPQAANPTTAAAPVNKMAIRLNCMAFASSLRW